jgi:hypothetical protein
VALKCWLVPSRRPYFYFCGGSCSCFLFFFAGGLLFLSFVLFFRTCLCPFSCLFCPSAFPFLCICLYFYLCICICICLFVLDLVTFVLHNQQDERDIDHPKCCRSFVLFGRCDFRSLVSDLPFSAVPCVVLSYLVLSCLALPCLVLSDLLSLSTGASPAVFLRRESVFVTYLFSIPFWESYVPLTFC